MLDLDAIRSRERNNQPPITQAERDRRALLAEVDRLQAFYSSLVAEAFDNGAAAERARIRAAVEGLSDLDKLSPMEQRVWAEACAAVLAAIEGGAAPLGGIEQFQDEDR